MRKRKKSVLLFLVLVLILSGCGTKSDVITITNVSYDPTREFYESYNTMFEEYYKKTYNKKVQVIQSHGGSGSQARSVVEGCNADVVTLALEHDISLIEKTGLVDAGWIKEFPKSNWFKFTSDTKVQFAMDNFHFKQALINLTTKKNNDIYEALLESVNSNNKKDFKLLIEQFKDLNQDRIETIENKEKYILNNWKERQTYLNNKYMRCSMESHISHILADLFTARPKAYSKKGLNHLLKLRLLKVNGTDIKKLYLNKLINPSEINECNTQTKINVNKIIFPTDTKTNKYLNNFYNTGMDTFDYIQKEEINFI